MSRWSKLAVHTDIQDEDQTIYFPEIGTTAKDADTQESIAHADEEVTLVDTVAYKNLVPSVLHPQYPHGQQALFRLW